MAGKTNYHALADFRYEIRRYLNFSEQAARTVGIEPQQHQALLAIKGLPDQSSATIGMLAERLQIHHHSAVELTDRLQSKRLLQRERGLRDRREVLLHLTSKGERLLRKLSTAHSQELQMAGPRLLAALRRAIEEKNSRVKPRALARRVKSI